MLLIRKQQMEAFAAAQVRRFEDRCVRLIRTEWNDDYAAYEEAHLRTLIDELLQFGAERGFHSERECFCLINIGAFIGLGFQHEAQHGWAVEMLGNRTLMPLERIEAIFDYAEVLESP